MIIKIIDTLGYKKQIYKSFLNKKQTIFEIFLEIDKTLNTDLFYLEEKIDPEKPSNQMIGHFFLAVFNNRLYFSRNESCFFLIINEAGLTGECKCKALSEDFVYLQLFKIIESISDPILASLLISDTLNYIKKN